MKNKITKNITIKAECYQTQYSWGHKAYILRDGQKIGYCRAVYQNRTWESYEYESVLKSLYEKGKKVLSVYELRQLKKMIDNGGQVEAEKIDKQFASVAMVAKIGELFTDNQKEANNWKTRMLKAGIIGLDMPENWDALPEDEKTARLDKVIQEMGTI